MIELSPTGEIASFLDVNQFQPDRTQFACGFFACAVVKSMSQVGQRPTQTAQEMAAEAEQWYAQYDGDNSTRNMDGNPNFILVSERLQTRRMSDFRQDKVCIYTRASSAAFSIVQMRFPRVRFILGFLISALSRLIFPPPYALYEQNIEGHD